MRVGMLVEDEEKGSVIRRMAATVCGSMTIKRKTKKQNFMFFWNKPTMHYCAYIFL